MIEMPFDEVMLSKSQITMPAGMQTKLEPEEWRPILASALIMSKKLRRKLLERVLIGLAALIAVSALLFVTLPVLLPGLVTTCSKSGACGQEPLGFTIASFVGLPLPLVGASVIFVLSARKLNSLADRMAADLVGTAYFLGVLNKIASFAGGQVNSRKRMGGPLSPFPSLGSRILKLQNYVAPS